MLESRLFKFGRILAFVILAIVTIYGIYGLVTGHWTDVTAYWRANTGIIPLLIGISVLDVVLEGLAWMWVYHRFGLKVFDRVGILAFLAGRAGLLMPAQLGRLIRPDAMVKKRRATVTTALKAEAVVFALDAVSVVSLLGGLVMYQLYPIAAPLVAIAVIVASMTVGNVLAQFISHTRLHLPAEFWWKWSTMAITLVCMLGWVAHGLALHVVVADLPGDMTLWDSLFFAPGSAVLGVATGLPGGIGATEGILGASLHVRSVPVEHLALAVAAFRLITFWMWIPIGWIGIALLRRQPADEAVAVQAESG